MKKNAEIEKRLDEIKTLVSSAGSTVPVHRAAFKKGFSFSALPFDQQLRIWDHVWGHAGNWWLRLHAYFFLEQYVMKKELHKAIWATSVAWQEDVDGWGLCDALAKVNTKILETRPAEVYKQLTKWNKSDNLWKRRQSVVSLLYFSRTKKAYLSFEQISALVEPLLKDPEYYVQKGVGWALREMHTVYPAATLPFLKKNIRHISAIAFTIAIEKMDVDNKNILKVSRKK